MEKIIIIHSFKGIFQSFRYYDGIILGLVSVFRKKIKGGAIVLET